MQIGEQVRERRRDLGLSQERLARNADVSLPTISRLERGSGVPKVALLRRIARALGVSLSSLVDDEEAA